MRQPRGQLLRAFADLGRAAQGQPQRQPGEAEQQNRNPDRLVQLECGKLGPAGHRIQPQPQRELIDQQSRQHPVQQNRRAVIARRGQLGR